MSTTLPSRPIDATLSVTKAARVLGVHPNTVRAWSDAGRLRYYRINSRGDRRYRIGDLHRFLSAAESVPVSHGPPPGSRRRLDPAAVATTLASASGRAGDGAGRVPMDDIRTSDTLDRRGTGRHQRDLALLDAIARRTATVRNLDDDLGHVARDIQEAFESRLVTIWQRVGDRLTIRAVAGAPDAAGHDQRPGTPRLRPRDVPADVGVLGRALSTTEPVVGHGSDRATGALVLDDGAELAVAIPGPSAPWGVLLIVTDDLDGPSGDDRLAANVVADTIGTLVGVATQRDETAHLVHRAEAVRRVAGDIGSRLDLDLILAGLVDHARVLFEGDRAAVMMLRPDGTAVAEVSHGLSGAYLAAIRDIPGASLPAAAVAERRPLHSVGYRDDPRGSGVRAAVVQEGFDTICTAPLVDGQGLLGTLDVYHDHPHDWTPDELETIGALATQASVAIRTAQNFEQMATWTAQLQSIQQLGARLNRLSSVRDIGLAIANELHELIDYHNARVYRLVGEDLIPVAMQGQIGEYDDETPDQLRVTLGQGITGWVAEHRIAQNLPDAAKDPRANTIPGTEDDLDESMLLAPMQFEDQVLGVLVLSKLGLDQFTDDDLRLLVIYASFAAQAMANADTTERLREQSEALERQLRSQRELLQITESILTTLDGRAVLEGITERLGGLIECDNVAIEVVDPGSGLLTPLTARGVNAAEYLEPWAPGETGVATWVVDHNEPVYVADERHDPRVNHFRGQGVVDGSLIVVPLRGRAGAIGVLTMERVGVGNCFSPEEFDLVKLFAAQVSIALQNAEVFRAVEIRAQTDALTGLLNHGTFQEVLGRRVRDGLPFGLIMLDLDDFRHVNNRQGHQVGDDALRAIATALVSAGRETDLVFRYGGDEFAFILPHTDASGTAHVAERARVAVRNLDGPVTASIGMASFPADGETAPGILLAADRACFVAKRGGRDRIATAAEGLALASEFSLQPPTPVDSEADPHD